MTDRELRELLTDAVDGIEPRYGLDEIRARTTTPKRRWPYAAGGALLAVAASLTAFALLPNDAGPQAVDPGSNTSGSPSPSSSASPSPSESTPPSASATEVPSMTVPVYYVGDTPDGPRLYREFRRVPASNPFEAAIAGLEQAPLDADYRTYWPAGAIERIHFDGIAADGFFQVVLADAALRDRPAEMDQASAEMAVEQVIYTLQASAGARAAVSFSFNGNPIDQVFGVPTSEPLANGPVLETLALVSLTTPSEGMVVDNDEPLVVEGVGNSYEGNIVTRLEGADGIEAIDSVPTIAGTYEERLFPFEVELDLTGVPPGEYTVLSQTDDPSGEQRFHVDSRNITVVD